MQQPAKQAKQFLESATHSLVGDLTTQPVNQAKQYLELSTDTSVGDLTAQPSKQATPFLELPTDLVVGVLTALAHQGETNSLTALACTHSRFAAILKDHKYLIQSAAYCRLLEYERRATHRLRQRIIHARLTLFNTRLNTISSHPAPKASPAHGPTL